jgi:hypothetical protein
MNETRLEHRIACNLDKFWQVFLDPEFYKAATLEGLGFPYFSIISQEDDGKTFRRVCEIQPKLDVPGPVAKLLGSSFRYREEAEFDHASKLWKFKVVPSVMTDKLFVSGEVRAVADGEATRRIVETRAEAKVFGIGGLIETSFVGELKKGWDQAAVFMNAWVAKH